MKPKISLILPCYHMEEYLSDIISDIRSQSFQDIEIILVNDGGGERQLEIMRQLKEEDDKIVIVDKPNGGLCSARNAGLKVATGEFISFVDPDDRLKPYYLQRLLEAITSENADIACGGYTFNYAQEHRTVEDFLKCSDLSTDGNKRIEYLLSVPTVRNAVWDKIYKAEFIRAHQLLFDEQLVFSEDETFNMHCFMHTNRIVLIADCGYIYMCRDTNSMCSKYVRNYREARMHALSLRIEVMKKICLTEERIHQILLEEYYLLGYFFLCNILKRGTPLSFREKKAYINSYILQDARIIEAVGARDYKLDNFFTKVYHWCFKSGNASCMVVVFGTLYKLKYNFMRLYAFLSPYLKGRQ